jgi:hypothetical protein
VPLSRIQTGILHFLASQRDPESYVAVATPLNRSTARYSSDIAIFHDRQARVAQAALADVAALQAAGSGLRWLRQLPLIHTVEVNRPDMAPGWNESPIAITDFPRPSVMKRLGTFSTRLILPPTK